MKKILLTAASFGLAFAISACSDDSSSSTGPEESGKTGDYTEYGSIDKDAKKVLAAAVKGTDFESIECDRVATQVVAGTNYKFQCNVKMDKESVEVFLTVFEPLPSSEESVKLTLVEDASGKVLYKAEEKSDEDGGYSKYKALDENAEKILAEVVKGSSFESIECDSVATQVVAGTNYKFQCSVKQGKMTMDVFAVIFKPLPSSGEPARLILVEDAAGNVLYKAEEKTECDESVTNCIDPETLKKTETDVTTNCDVPSNGTVTDCVDPGTVKKLECEGTETNCIDPETVKRIDLPKNVE